MSTLPAVIYSPAVKIDGYWTVTLASNPDVVQFRSLSRKIANEWRTVNGGAQ